MRIIHFHWINTFIDVPSFFKYNKKPVVWTLHDMNPFTSSLLARTSMTALFYPLDNIRTNQRNFAGLSMSDVIKQIYRHYGPLGFYRGVLLYSMTSTPNFVLMVTIKDILESYLK